MAFGAKQCQYVALHSTESESWRQFKATLANQHEAGLWQKATLLAISRVLRSTSFELLASHISRAALQKNQLVSFVASPYFCNNLDTFGLVGDKDQAIFLKGFKTTRLWAKAVAKAEKIPQYKWPKIAVFSGLCVAMVLVHKHPERATKTMTYNARRALGTLAFSCMSRSANLRIVAVLFFTARLAIFPSTAP